jgi:hypothetical protein
VSESIEDQFWLQMSQSGSKTFICPPGEVCERVLDLVAKAGLQNVITVTATLACPADSVIAIDNAALQWPTS